MDQQAINQVAEMGRSRFVGVRSLRPIVGTTLSSLRWPMLLSIVYSWLSAVGREQILAAQLERGIAAVLPMVMLVAMLRSAVGSNGVCASLLGWSANDCQSVRRGLGRALGIVAPLWGGCEFLKWYSEGRFSDSLGRVLLMLSMLGLAGMLKWMLQPMMSDLLERRGGVTLRWLRGGLATAMIVSALPLTLAGLAAAGYRFAAEQLAGRIVWSLLIGFVVTMVWSMVLRGWEAYRHHREQQVAADGGATREKLAELATCSGQVVRILNLVGVIVAAWAALAIWSAVFPVQEWLSSASLPLGSGATIRELVGAIAVALVALSFSRNVGGLIELLLPLRLPLDRGGRFAVTFVARYLIGLVGLLWASSLLGFDWDRVQWLAAGLTVGLGFGLQEVFANLVSGLIILIERPVRVGDFVSVNNVTGTVTKMALRATTIIDADRREWIVPNKSFITSDVMNWTLSDRSCRLVFPISVAHGSDSRKVQAILLDVAKRQPRILDFPEPSAVFVRIGPRSLDFELRVFLADQTGLGGLQTEINVQLVESLQAAEIEVCLETLGWEGERSERGAKRAKHSAA